MQEIGRRFCNGKEPRWQEEQDGCQAGSHAEESRLGPDGTGRQSWVCSKRETCSGLSGSEQNVNCACDNKGGRGCCPVELLTRLPFLGLSTSHLQPLLPQLRGRGSGRDVAKAGCALVTLFHPLAFLQSSLPRNLRQVAEPLSPSLFH